MNQTSCVSLVAIHFKILFSSYAIMAMLFNVCPLLLSLLILKLKIKHARLKQFYEYYMEAICFAGKNRIQPERRED